MAQTIPLSTVLANQVSKAGASLLFWGWWSHTASHPGFLVLTTTQRHFSLKGDVMSNLNPELHWVQHQNLDVLLKSQWSSGKAHSLSLRAINTVLWTYRPDTGRREVGSAWLDSEKEKMEPFPLSFFILTPHSTHCNSLCWKHHTRSFPPRSFQLNIATLKNTTISTSPTPEL